MVPKKQSKNILSLPPDLIVKIFSLLPARDLASLASVSRRFKILSYNDNVYEEKLKCMGITGTVDEAMSMSDSASFNKSFSDALFEARNKMEKGGSDSLNNSMNKAKVVDQVETLASRLKQLPGGHFLPANTTYLETGTLWGGIKEDENEESEGDSSSEAEVSIKETKGLSPVEISVTTEAPVQQITSALPDIKNSPINPSLPDIKNSSIIIGSGGLKALQKKTSGLQVGAMKKSPSVTGNSGMKKSSSKYGTINKCGRETFKQVFVELKPYFIDFRKRQRDSKLFRDFSDLVEIATILRRLRLFGKAKVIDDVEDINFSLETTIEWFESMILSQFEAAYDKEKIGEMRKNAFILYHLNKGAACVQIFISKNPLFFDETYNPTLVGSKLPTATTGPQGYALADDFAKFIEHLLSNCRKQISIISQVFPAEMDALTLFVNKVFDDSIAEYLNAVLITAREREGVNMYLHTLASSIHSCLQFIDFLGKNKEVPVNTEVIKDNMSAIFKKYTERYIATEIEYLESRYKTEMDKWNKSKENMMLKCNGGVKAAGEKKKMNTMMSVLWAPVAITQAVTTSVTNTVTGGKSTSPLKQSLLTDANEPTSPTSGMSPTSFINKVNIPESSYYLEDDSLNSQISLEFCINVLHMDKECLGRVLVVTACTDISKIKPNVEKVFCSLLKVIGQKHIKVAFNNAQEKLSAACEKSDTENLDSLQFFELIHIADLVTQMVDVYYNADVKPWIDENDAFSDIVIEKKAFTRLLDDNIALGMDKSVQVLVAQVENIMTAEQGKNDFCPPENSPKIFDIKPTKACVKVIETIDSHAKLLAGVADKNTLEVFYGEIATSDLNKYFEWANSLRVSAVARLFGVLKEIGNLFLADGGSELKELIHDTQMYQGALRLEEVLELLQSRTDYKKIQKFVENSDCIIQ
ncbi:F-box protein: endocytic membrane traffic, recycling ReCYcling 1 [Clydaea vesicula]|uniref:F-box protein: endocytic membrane traffic, recycling ReCYcling 1 n=1 Tax=Clydaea vesicula TaxID=447962 RepID=A0AAD5U2W5_9FUNG|nr:F-box protein: endocytic membrane traffic, recycling ReCYcling 1 [Clydaea vesicula]